MTQIEFLPAERARRAGEQPTQILFPKRKRIGLDLEGAEDNTSVGTVVPDIFTMTFYE
jgi:hypothetical protein